MTGAPLAVLAVSRDGSPTVRWVNRSMADLLGFEDAGDARVALADVVDPASRARAVAAARDVVIAGEQSASVQVVTTGDGPRTPVWFHLLALPAHPLRRVLAAVGLPVVRQVILHARAADRTTVEQAADAASGRAHLADRLGAALLRQRRHPGRIALALVHVHLRTPDGLRLLPDDEAGILAERVRTAARDTDTVARLGSGRLGVLAEDSAEGGETAMARRVLAVVDRALADGPPHVVAAAVLQVGDPDADPDEVLEHLGRTADPLATRGGLTVLPAWGSARAEQGRSPDAATTRPERTRRALSSGRFVLGARTLRRASSGEPRNGAAVRPPVLLEVGTVDDGRLTPVRVSAPGLAAALDQWALGQLATLQLPDTAVALRLQAGGPLATALGDAAVSLLDQRPGLRLVLSVPEARLEEAMAAQRSVLRRLSTAGVGLGVSDWSGRLEAATLVRAGVALVELSPECQREVVRPEGAARVAGLLAALAAGTHPGPGRPAPVVIGDLGEMAVTLDPVPWGIVWAASSPGLMMTNDDGGPKQTGSGRPRRDVRRPP